MNKVIQKAITIAGSQEELARLVGVNQSAVHKWLYGGGIRSQYIASISRATKGVITTSEILASMDLSNGRNSNESVA
ncbi:transcriptional regulator [Salmonella enterica]|uniref:transcriptional regulator n=1 Tax=Salmonella enterica TaxID=28901 RepID=UPI00127987E7|nr:toxin-antitoxin system antitoxin [Salmonella enterica]EBY0802689.1 toxin-antitoxin system antitoxin [Salmonella enterica subsp. enterica serovar Berlin]ECE0793883.1 toxin-antitoxin system antitoxin [Salmonella enterica subsp. diarizonae]ECF1925522.1 toxin-antitoxin system antitoxin [Salmonella enterica subsp. enterica serovar Newport]ECI5955669.1 toxin-antitoxin system antitoxin [Salmonella enterica subsp. enterica serovar Hvittingfoss]EDW2059393.1 helix-turn-helix domain-containing protein